MGQVIWNSEWIRPFESPWSIFEKFRFANVVSKTTILRTYGSQAVQSIKNQTIGDIHRNLYHLNGFDDSLLQQGLSFDLKQHVYHLIHNLKSILPDRYTWFHTNLVWCEQCLNYGYHSLFHQFVLLQHCPFHKTPLVNQCPKCNETFPYLLKENAMESPFTCKCGYRFADLTERWNIWKNNSAVIKCNITQKWLDLNCDNETGTRLMFIPDYAGKNKHALPLLIHAYDESFNINGEEGRVTKTYFNSNYQKWSVFDNPKIKTEHTGVLNSAKVRGIYRNQIEFEKMYDYFYEHSRGIYKSIDEFIRRKTLKGHFSCVRRFHEVLKEENKPFPPICPHAYAYVLWKQSLLGYESYYEHKMGAHKVKNIETFDLVNRYFTEENDYIFDQFVENSFNFRIDRPWELLWIFKKITGILCLSFFHVWQNIALYGAKENLAPDIGFVNTLIHEYTPLFVIRHQINLSHNTPVTMFEYSTFNQTQFREDLLCPYQKKEKRINPLIEKVHTPIAYSMRYFGDHPDNYNMENQYINKYVNNLNAPTKFSRF